MGEIERGNFLMVWTGDRYGPEYPAILADMICRNADQLESWSVSCITDHAPEELPAGVNHIPADPRLTGWWQKVKLFDPALPFEPGERLCYFDLDVVIKGRLEDLVETRGIIQDWNWPTYNSSVMVWDHGEHAAIWTEFTPDVMGRPSTRLAGLLPAGQVNGGDQEWIFDVSSWPTFPKAWFRSAKKLSDWPPEECKAVIFHGHPKPHEVLDGWVPQVWRIGGFAAVPEMRGVNVTHEQLIDNIRVNSARELPWFCGAPVTKRRLIIVGGAPSLREAAPELRWHVRQGAQVASVNNSWRWLVEQGITPGVHIMCDARPENAEFVKDAPEGVRYFIASQSHPSVFEALKDRDVILWHVAFGDNAELREVLDPWWETRPINLVPGGGTVTLRAIWLGHYSGFRKIHLYGVDSSYAEADEHHAYAQPLNAGERIMEVTVVGTGKTYRAAPWMVRQVQEFKQHEAALAREGTQLFVHGRGLLPDVAALLRKERAA